MPTNEERKEIAAKLRELSEGVLDFREYGHRAICAIVGCWGDGEYSNMELKDRLADLIEPEERTCRNEAYFYAPGLPFVCSECTRAIDEYEYVPLIGKYCTCGAKRVD